ncbi:4'-phosphopantetheinyl transferase superfamily protein [Bosea sp. AAP35]|uniref:4'-phosphopantetheinyl transferase family protein n=1 Tax=Bosea sp. AAP35 TaxID=1523417 RepID=UPI0009E81B12|nr:4'-phosphopantetheinyl transferase superfamily protein [Bosea sp. AAP35]
MPPAQNGGVASRRCVVATERLPYPAAMLWLTSPDLTATTLPAAWLIATGAQPANLIERSQLRRGLAQRVVARHLGLTPDAVTIGHDHKGRPLIEAPNGTGLQLSLATRAGFVMVGLAETAIGVDVERIDPDAALPPAVLHRDERAAIVEMPPEARPLAFARLWSAKEAYVKALGTGFARPPESFSVTLLSSDRFSIADPTHGRTTPGSSRTIENGGQEILAAAMVVLD